MTFEELCKELFPNGWENFDGNLQLSDLERAYKSGVQAAPVLTPAHPDVVQRFEAAVIRRLECRNPAGERGHRAHDAAEAEYEAARAALPVAWLRAIDEAMVCHHVGVADASDDYATAKDKLNRLLCAAQDIGALHAAAAPVLTPAHPAIAQALEALEKAGELGFYAAKARRVLRLARGQEVE